MSQRIFYPVPAIPAEGNTGAVKEESVRFPIAAYLEYVETDGTQYIDTGVVGKSGTTAEFIEVSLCSKSSDVEYFLGAKGSEDNSRFFMWYHRNHFVLGLGYGSENWTPSIANPTEKVEKWDPQENPDAYRLPNGRINHVRVAFSGGSQKVVSIDDATGTKTTVADRAISGGMDTAQNLYAFACNNNGTPTDFAKSRLYWLTLRQNGNYIRKFQPVRLKNGLVGLWDIVNEITYLPKSASGGYATFSAVGPESEKIFVKSLMLLVR